MGHAARIIYEKEITFHCDRFGGGWRITALTRHGNLFAVLSGLKEAPKTGREANKLDRMIMRRAYGNFRRGGIWRGTVTQ